MGWRNPTVDRLQVDFLSRNRREGKKVSSLVFQQELHALARYWKTWKLVYADPLPSLQLSGVKGKTCCALDSICYYRNSSECAINLEKKVCYFTVLNVKEIRIESFTSSETFLFYGWK